jgi:hypothetical protein
MRCILKNEHLDMNICNICSKGMHACMHEYKIELEHLKLVYQEKTGDYCRHFCSKCKKEFHYQLITSIPPEYFYLCIHCYFEENGHYPVVGKSMVAHEEFNKQQIKLFSDQLAKDLEVPKNVLDVTFKGEQNGI